jgi:hypothetical protein
MITALASGAFLGVSCGLAPGPLLAQTLRHGPREGCKIALTPLAFRLQVLEVRIQGRGDLDGGRAGRRPAGPRLRQWTAAASWNK